MLANTWEIVVHYADGQDLRVLMRIRLFLAVFSVAIFAGSSTGYTQAAAAFFPAGPGPIGPFCHLLTGAVPGQAVTACAKPLINRQSLINTSTSIRNIIVGRFDAGPNQTEPAGLELTGANEILERLSGDGSFIIAPFARLEKSALQSSRVHSGEDEPSTTSYARISNLPTGRRA